MVKFILEKSRNNYYKEIIFKIIKIFKIININLFIN